jgi:hypothetical protein
VCYYTDTVVLVKYCKQLFEHLDRVFYYSKSAEFARVPLLLLLLLLLLRGSTDLEEP